MVFLIEFEGNNGSICLSWKFLISELFPGIEVEKNYFSDLQNLSLRSNQWLKRPRMFFFRHYIFPNNLVIYWLASAVMSFSASLYMVYLIFAYGCPSFCSEYFFHRRFGHVFFVSHVRHVSHVRSLRQVRQDVTVPTEGWVMSWKC